MPEFVVALLLAGCLPETVPRNCDSRIAYYPDADGDGFGERTGVYIGCEPPPGWVALLEEEPPVDSGPTTSESGAASGDTGPPVDTADTTTTDTTTTDTTDTDTDTGVPTAETGVPTDTSDTATPSTETGIQVDTSETADTGP